MFECFYPKEYIDSAYKIDFKKYYDRGFRALVLDVDNTLVEHGAPANEEAIAFFENVRSIGFKTCIVSNNDEERIKPFATAVKSEYVFDAGKPSAKGYNLAMKILGCDRMNSMFIGDQLFTDIWGANRAGIYNILVKYIKLDNIFYIKLKRWGEKIVLHFYFKKMEHK